MASTASVVDYMISVFSDHLIQIGVLIQVRQEVVVLGELDDLTGLCVMENGILGGVSTYLNAAVWNDGVEKD